MALEDYLPFDPSEPPWEMSNGSEMDNYVHDIFDMYGWSTWGDAFVDITDPGINPEYERGVRYSTPEEALVDAFERGILGFTHIAYYPEDHMYSIYIEYDETTP